MSSFMSYTTTDPNSTQKPLAADASIIVGPFSTGIGTSIVGVLVTDQPGTLVIEQTMDWNPADPDGSKGLTHWDVQTDAITVAANTPYVISTGSNAIPIVGGFAQATFTNTGDDQTFMRFFLRAIGNRGVA